VYGGTLYAISCVNPLLSRRVKEKAIPHVQPPWDLPALTYQGLQGCEQRDGSAP
jgi:hypothetical protein